MHVWMTDKIGEWLGTEWGEYEPYDITPNVGFNKWLEDYVLEQYDYELYIQYGNAFYIMARKSAKDDGAETDSWLMGKYTRQEGLMEEYGVVTLDDF